MPWLAFSDVFKFEPKLSKAKNLAFLCKHCTGKKIIFANKTSTSNLKKHVKVCFIYLYQKIVRVYSKYFVNCIIIKIGQ